MSWKCDKCKNTYNDNVKAITSDGYNFCPNCVCGEEVDEENIIKKNNARLLISRLTVCAAVVFLATIIIGIVFINSALIKVSIPVWVGGFVATVVIMGIDDAIAKRNK